MGTRADFYVGRDKNAEWLGSIGWDGYWSGIDNQITQCTSEAAFRHAVVTFIADREDGTKPEQGWPWPWNDSDTTDCAYAFDAGQVWQEAKGYWVDGTRDFDYESDVPENAMRCDFPDMSERKAVTYGARSGLIIFGGSR